MSFGGSAFGAGAFGVNASTDGGSAQSPSELQEIQSTEIEFQGLNGEAKVQILPTGWPDDNLPSTTSSLLSVCSSRNFLAAAGPDTLVFSSIDSVREAFKQQEANGNVRSFKPQVSIPLSTRVSQVAFSSDGDCLVISAETGGGLAAYDTKALMNGDTNTAFELGSNHESLRALVPNPADESSQLFAVVTQQGKLMIADLKSRSWKSGKNGPVYAENVSAVAWSNKGKALLAGLANGSLVQIRSDGTPMGQIPKPPTLEGEKHVSAIAWLENNLGVIVYTSGDTEAMGDSSEFYIWERSGAQNSPSHTFSKLPEVASGWGDRKPASQYISKLRDYHNCNHILLVSNTASEDVGAIVRSTVPLAEGAPSNVFVSLTQSNDSRRAQLPMKPDFSASTSPIGMALDTASKEAVARPIPGGEEDQSPGPLPGLMILNNDGVLAEWWVVYADAIRKGIEYTGMVVHGGDVSTSTGATPKPSAQPASSNLGAAIGRDQQPAFGKSSFAANAPAASFGQNSMGSVKPAFGQVATFGQSSMGVAKPTFGQPSFGAPGALGADKPTFGSTSAFGAAKSAFNSPSVMSGTESKPSTFGAASAVAVPNTSNTVFGQPSTFGQPSSFGQPSKFGASTSLNTGSSSASPFSVGPASSVFGGNSSASSPFAQVAKVSGDTAKAPFGAFASTSQSSFGQPVSLASPFASLTSKAQGTDAASPFANKAEQKSTFGAGGAFATQNETKSLFASAPGPALAQNSFGQPEPFSIASSFEKTATTADSEISKDDKDSGQGFFSGEFSDALKSTTSKDMKSTSVREEPMGGEDTQEKAPESPEIIQSTTPKETPAIQKTSSLFGANPPSNVTPKPSNLFGMSAPLMETPRSGGLFGNSTPVEASKPKPQGMPTFSFTSDTPKPGKSEQRLDADKSAGETPLPPESTTKVDAPPMPPDFLTSKSKPQSSSADADAPPLPPDFVQLKPSAPTPAKVVEPEKAMGGSKSDDAPLPPDFLVPAGKAAGRRDEPPPLPADDTSPIDDEGSGIDVANELSVEGSPESSFGSKSSNVFIPRPNTKPSKPGGSVFDMVPKPNIPFFSMPPPSKDPESPRSPSPVRTGRGTNEMKPPPFSSRSVSGPAIPRVGQGMRKPTVGRQQPPTKFAPPVTSLSNDVAAVDEELRAAEKRRQQQQAAEEQDLSDDEDDYYRSVLSKPIEPTTTLGSFFAHTDYTGGVSKEGVPGQIEIVYRDANSMVDTLGMNARSIANWIAGHSVSSKLNGRSGDRLGDLEDPDEWTLVDAENLLAVERKVERELEGSAPSNKQAQTLTKLAENMSMELNRLRRKNEDVAQTIENLRTDASENDDNIDVSPLGAAAAESQQDLRRALTDFRNSLAKAEEQVALLRVKLSSVIHDKKEANGRSNVPTVEAVERTISKMTAMIERKSMDVDVMISQAKQLGIVDEKRMTSKNVLAHGHGRRSRSGSPFESPVGSRPGSSARSNYGTPLRGSVSQIQFTPNRSKLRSSMILAERMNELTIVGRPGHAIAEAVANRHMEKIGKKREVKIALKEALDTDTPRIRTLDDD